MIKVKNGVIVEDYSQNSRPWISEDMKKWQTEWQWVNSLIAKNYYVPTEKKEENDSSGKC